MACKPAMKSPRADGPSGIRAHTAHASSSGESRLAVRNPIASCMAPATVWPPAAASAPGVPHIVLPAAEAPGRTFWLMGAHTWQHAGGRGTVHRPALAAALLAVRLVQEPGLVQNCAQPENEHAEPPG